MKIFTVICSHPSVPGVQIVPCASLAIANDEAARLINIVRADSTGFDPLPAEATAETWEPVLEQLQDWHGAAHCWLDINESLLAE